MAVIKAKPILVDKKKGEKREIYAEVCYHFPQYTLEEVSRLPARDVKLLLEVARKKQAELMFNLVQVVAAPHTKKGEGVKKLSKHFKDLIDK